MMKKLLLLAALLGHGSALAQAGKVLEGSSLYLDQTVRLDTQGDSLLNVVNPGITDYVGIKAKSISLLNGTEFLSFGSTGQLIRSLTDSSKIQVSGDLARTSVGVDSVFGLIRKNSGSIFPQVADFQIGRYLVSGNDARTRLDLLLNNTAVTSVPDTTVMTWLANGNVGIGTVTPNLAKLDLTAGNLRFDRGQGIFWSANSTTAGDVILKGTDVANTVTLFASSIPTLQFQDGSGIGTTLGVDYVKVPSTGRYRIGDGATMSAPSGSDALRLASFGNYIDFYDNQTNTSWMRLDSTTGNFGIGTTTPSYTLDVLGSFHLVTGSTERFRIIPADFDVSVGSPAASSVATGTSAFGVDALANVTGDKNSAFGSLAGDGIITGTGNLLGGSDSDTQASSTNDGVGLGRATIVATSAFAGGVGAKARGTDGIALGRAACTLSASIMIGPDAGANCTENQGTNTIVGGFGGHDLVGGGNNSGLGLGIFSSLTTGSRNTGNGERALNQLVGGDDNTGDGRRAGFTLTSGSSDSFFGANADTTSNSVTNSSAIGANTKVTTSNQFVMGDVSVTEYLLGTDQSSTAAAVARTLRGGNASGTNQNAGSLTIQAPRSTGTGTPGAVIIKTSVAGTSGSSLNAVVTMIEATNDGTGVDLRGTTTNDAAAAGFVGETFSGSLVRSSANALADSVTENVDGATALALTAGDWDVSASCGFTTSTSTVTQLDCAVATTSATMPATDTISVPTAGEIRLTDTVAFTLVSAEKSYPVPTYRVSLSATTTLYLVARAAFSAGSVSAFGSIQARRVR